MDRTEPLIVEPGEVRPGVWCENCALPSAFEVSLYRLTADGVTPAISTVTYCPECEGWGWVTPDSRS